MPNFSSRIKLLRTERGITQEQLASMLKVSRSTIGMYESGKREPDFETSEAIADIFNVDMDFLMGRSDVERKHPLTNKEPCLLQDFAICENPRKCWIFASQNLSPFVL